MPVKHSDDVETVKLNNGEGVSRRVLISAEEGPNFAMRKFRIEPGGGMPRHINLVEHEQYVVSGRAKIGIGDGIFEVKQGDVVFIPAEVPHWYKNEGSESFEFLCVVPNKPDRISVLE